MRPIRSLPPVEVLEQWFYEEPAGVLCWRKDYTFGNWIKPTGSVAGVEANQRIFISLFGQTFLRARLIWKMHKGIEPPKALAHRNNNTLDDKIENLVDREELKREQIDPATKKYLEQLKPATKKQIRSYLRRGRERTKPEELRLLAEAVGAKPNSFEDEERLIA